MQKYAIQFNNKTVELSLDDGWEKPAFNILASLLGLVFVTYLFFVGMTIMNIVDRKNIENSNRTLSSRVSELELSYLSESNKIDLAMAYSLGFKDAKDASFASRSGASKDLSMARN